jgi:putative SOS response-associated peptidase YedK
MPPSTTTAKLREARCSLDERRHEQAQDRQLAFLRWGLIPAWVDDPSIGDRLANARSETAATSPPSVCLPVAALPGGR